MQSFLSSIFLTAPDLSLPQVTGSHTPGLVALSLMAAILSSGIALQLAGVARDSGTVGLRVMALVTGAFALGAGVWSMHFIGMLAFRLCTSVTFDAVLTAASMLPSFAASLLTLTLLSRRKLSRRALFAGGFAVGAGIGLMHYAGMAAMEMSLLLRYDPAWFALSIGVAVAFAMLALWVRFGLREKSNLSDRSNLVLSAVVMGFAIAGMHYTAMRAARFIGVEDDASAPMPSQTTAFALAIALMLLLICGLATLVNLMLRYRHLYRENQRAGQALRESERQYRNMVATIPGITFQLAQEPDGRTALKFVSEAIASITGWPARDILEGHITFDDLVHPADLDQRQALLADAFAKRRSYSIEYRMISRSGTLIWVSEIGTCTTGADDTTCWIDGFIMDVTASKLQQANFSGKMAAVDRVQAIIEFSLDGIILDANSNFLQTFGFEKREVVGQHHRIFCDPAFVASEDYKAFWDHLATGAYHSGEFRRLSKSGREVWIQAVYVPIYDADGTPIKVVKVATNITSAKLRNADFESMVTANRRALNMIEFSIDGRILDVNDNFLALTGYSRDELVGAHHGILCKPEDVASEAYAQHWDALRRGEFRTGEFLRRGKHGRDLWFQATYHPVLDVDGRPTRIIKFVTDLSERHAMELDLRIAKETAELAARSKTAFLANMSHEIRTPMNAIIGFTDVLLETRLDKSQRSHLETVSRAGRSLLGLLNDILDTAKLESGSVELELADFSLQQVCLDVVATMRLSASRKGLALGLDYAPDVEPFFKGDALRVQQVLLNLVGNAIKFTERGHVDIRVLRDEGAVRIEVEDTGIGIAADRLDRIFEAFAQADVSTTRRFGGTGLGTTIARQFVKLMGGEIGVRSEIGMGSCFWIRLPLPAGAEPKSERTDHVIQLPPLRILVADDVIQNADLLQLRLGKLGHTVEVASNGAEARDAVAARSFDIVLMDVQMPVMDGEAATRAIREHEKAHGLQRLPVIALTAGVLERDRLSAVESGMDGFAVKPVDLRKLLAEIARVLQIEAPYVPAPAVTAPGPEPEGDGIDWGFGIDLWGDRQALEGRIERFARDTLTQIPGMTDLRGMERRNAAHRIKGAAANLALNRVREIAARLEHAETADDQTPPLWDQVRRELTQLQDRLGVRGETAAVAEATNGLTIADLKDLARNLEHGELPEDMLERLYAGLPAEQRSELQDSVENFDFDKAAGLVKAMICAA